MKLIFNWIRRVRYTFDIQILKVFQTIILFLVQGLSPDKLVKKAIELPLYGNSQVGKQLTRGQYIFAGVQFDLEVDNPWLIEPPSPDVELCLHGFCWLNDLASYGNFKARNCALEWLKKWDFYYPFGKKIGGILNFWELRVEIF